jgi:hypothetical protein
VALALPLIDPEGETSPGEPGSNESNDLILQLDTLVVSVSSGFLTSIASVIHECLS